MTQNNQRPERSVAKALLQNAEATYVDLTNIANSHDSLQLQASKSASDLKQSAALAEMAQMDIEILNANKEGIRISTLRGAGINNIAQLYGLPIRNITAINGIGDQNAIRIRQIVNDIYANVIATTKVHINTQARTAQQDQLVRAIFILRHAASLCKQAKSLLAAQPYIQANIQHARPLTKTLSWLFAGNTKKANAQKAYDYLSWLFNSEFSNHASRCISSYKTATVAGISDAYADFEQNSVAWYTLMENLGLSAPSATTAQASGLPAELVAYVEGYPIDLRHMRAELRRYQEFGAKYALTQQKTLLGDEMGLGKTIQALAVIADLCTRGESHFLVVCPASVLVNWKRETDKHTDLRSIIIHGWDKDEEFQQWRMMGGVGITNYESLKKLTDNLDFRFGALIVDEAHFVKNPEAQRTKALQKAALKTDRILYMTGTPLENRVDEMCFLVGCLRPEIATKLASMKTLSSTAKFRAELAPIYLRRIRDDVLGELPDLIENEDWLEPNNYELQSYRKAVFSGNFMAMRRISWDVNTNQSSKAQRLLEICEEARDDNRKLIIFSFFRDTLTIVCDLLGTAAIGPITGSVSTEMRQRLIDEFTAAANGTALVAQVQAGGVGLNIQAASVVVFCEPQIKPSLETQAISRAYRMGQIHDVHVHRLLCEGTVDERMLEILQSKQLEFDTYAEESVAGTESLKQERESTWIKELVEKERARLSSDFAQADAGQIDSSQADGQ